MATLQGIWESIQGFFQDISSGISAVGEMENSGGLLYTAVARWIFIILALFILVKSIASLLLSRNPSEVWAYFNVDGIVSRQNPAHKSKFPGCTTGWEWTGSEGKGSPLIGLLQKAWGMPPEKFLSSKLSLRPPIMCRKEME